MRLITGGVSTIGAVSSAVSLMSCFASGYVSSYIGVSVSLPVPFAGGIVGVSVVSTAVAVLWADKHITKRSRELFFDELLGGRIFGKIYAKRISENDGTLLSLWNRVLVHIKADTLGQNASTLLTNLRSTAGSDWKRRVDLKDIELLIETHIPALRRLAAPTLSPKKKVDSL